MSSVTYRNGRHAMTHLNALLSASAPAPPPRSPRKQFREWYGAYRALRDGAPAGDIATHTHHGLGLIFRAGHLMNEWNGIHRVEYAPSSFVLGLVVLDEARGAAKGFRRCAIFASRDYRIHGTTRACPIPA
jgi:hypothetical protein